MTIPNPSDANQWRQVISIDAEVEWNSLNARAPPIPETAAPTAAAATNPTTLCSLLNLKSAST